ncbi:protein eyes shut homolog isoform X2 [Narcine bancroftii]|uniref:protein eyes shut homolog isoform X2 n=1 Tax=Narcine bancroftii TaxID=1343680 RepID=UPI0038319E3A
MTGKAKAYVIRSGSTYFKVITAVCILHSFQNCRANERTVHQRDEGIEWSTDIKKLHINWTQTNTNSDVDTECWSLSMWNISFSNIIINLDQNCPLEVQLGVTIFLLPDLSVVMHGRNLANVSRAEFTNCSMRQFPKTQLLFGGRVQSTQQIHPKWLTIGTHFLVEVQNDGLPLCRLGLRINLTVKPENCRAFHNSELCSSHGKCQTQPWQAAYYCHCHPPYTGLFCEEYDACSIGPCLNGGTCIDMKEGLDGNGYDCTCPPQFSGVLCEEMMRYCDSQPCLNGGACQNTMAGYICDCPAGFIGCNCEINIDECSSAPCLNGGSCLDGINDFTCSCAAQYTGDLCETVVRSCDSCLNYRNCIHTETSSTPNNRSYEGLEKTLPVLTVLEISESS